MSESQIEAASVKAANRLGWYGLKLHCVSVVGLPDRMFIGHGKVVFIEYKTEKGALSKVQIAAHRKFAQHGITVHVARSVADTIEILEREQC